MLEAGKDYIAVKSGHSSRKRRWISVATMAIGLILLSSAGGYFVYASIARSQLGDLEYPGVSGTASSLDRPITDSIYVIDEGTKLGSNGLGQGKTNTQISASNFIQLYPGKLLPGLYWDNPRWTDVQYYDYASVLQGFNPWESLPDPHSFKDLSSPIRIEIPSLSIDSSVKALEIKAIGDIRAWETPKNVVGHIPTTANPGENGIVYLFGHLQSPLKGEGSVFRDLPQIPGLLRQGEKVFLILHNRDNTEFLYEVTHTDVVKASRFMLEESDSRIVMLVSCVPKYVYDHRLLVTASLVGIKTR